MQFYVRVRIYLGDTVYEDILIIRFICRRLNPNVPPGTHRTFSLLPYPLVPYSPYALPTTFTLAAALTEHGENPYQTSQVLASQYENLNPEPATLTRIKHRLLEAVHKLKQVPQKFQSLISPLLSRRSITLSELLALLGSYQSPVLVSASGARALSYDWFYVFQEERPYMQRDFLFGTPSQKRGCV